MPLDGLQQDDPRRIGAYRLLARLGAGGMGQVFLGRSPGGRTVAIKLVHAELARDPEFRRRFRQEVQAAREVGGAFTAAVLDDDTEADTPWLASAYIPGPSLHEVVGETYGPLPEHSVWTLATGLARALRAVHACGLVHRDLKPSNVLLTLDGPRVIDFGIARAVDASVATRTGAVIGTPAFMAPEQVKGEPVTPPADVFALGNLLAYAATGRQPFATADSGVHALLLRIVSAEPDLDGVPGGLRGLIESCLAKDPAERASLEDVLERSEPHEASGGAPWLPPELVAGLGRHAAELLDLDEPAEESGTDSGSGSGSGAGSSAGTGDGAASATPSAPSPPPPGAPPPPAPRPNMHPGTPAYPGYGARGGTPPPGPPPGARPPGYTPHHAPPPGPPPSTPPPGRTHPGYGPSTPPPGGAYTSTGIHPVQPARRTSVSVQIAAGAVVVLFIIAVIAVAIAVRAGRDGGGGGTPSGAGSQGPGSQGPGSQNGSGDGSGSGDVPAAFLGTWSGTIGGSEVAPQTRRMVITQGDLGDDVVTTKGSDHRAQCTGVGSLEKAAPRKIVLRTRLTSSKPAGFCVGAGAQTLTLSGDGTLGYDSGNAKGTLRRKS